MRKRKTRNYERVGIVQISDVFPHVGKATHTFHIFNKSYQIIMKSLRYVTFKQKGTDCIRCGITGKYFAIERSSGIKYHLNLYARTPEGKEVLMTKDHTIPTSKGGKNRLSNLQPMCTRCNGKKADTYDEK